VFIEGGACAMAQAPPSMNTGAPFEQIKIKKFQKIFDFLLFLLLYSQLCGLLY